MKYWLMSCWIFFSLPVTAAQTIFLNQVFWPPFFIDTTAGPSGFAASLLERCIDPAQYRLKYLSLPIKRTHYYMQNGELDITIYSYKKQREQDVWYGAEPLFITDYGFMVRADSPIQIKHLNDVLPLRIGQLAGLTHTAELMQIIEQKRGTSMLLEGYNLDQMFDQLLNDPPRFDIMANSKETFVYAAAQRNLTDKIKVLDYTLEYRAYYVTVSKHSKNIHNPQLLLQQIDQCLSTLKQSGEYLQLAKRAEFTPPAVSSNAVIAPRHN